MLHRIYMIQHDEHDFVLSPSRLIRTVSPRNKLERIDHSLRFGESFHPVPRGLRVVLLAEGHGDRIANTRAADSLASNRNFKLSELNRPLRLLPERAEPARRPLVPGAHKNSPINDNNPDPCVAVLSSGTHAEDPGLI